MSPNSSTHADRIACWLAVNRSVSGRPRGSRSLRQGRLPDDEVTSAAAVDNAPAGLDTAVSLLPPYRAVKTFGYRLIAAYNQSHAERDEIGCCTRAAGRSGVESPQTG